VFYDVQAQPPLVTVLLTRDGRPVAVVVGRAWTGRSSAPCGRRTCAPADCCFGHCVSGCLWHTWGAPNAGPRPMRRV